MSMNKEVIKNTSPYNKTENFLLFIYSKKKIIDMPHMVPGDFRTKPLKTGQSRFCRKSF